MAMHRMVDIDLAGKRVLMREDLNVPIKDGQVSSDIRIRAAADGIRTALEAGAAVLVASHLGRPKEGGSAADNAQFSLAPVAQCLGEILGRPVPLIKDWLDGPPSVQPGNIVLLENVRFNPGEKADDESLARQLAGLCDIFVMDAFGTAHRAQASTHGVARFAPVACAGPLLIDELEALGRALAEPQRPLTAIIGGAKVSTKLEVLDSLADKVDLLIPGGGIANTFLAAAGFAVGKSLYEPDLLDVARRLLERIEIPLPVDVVVADEFSATATAVHCAVDQVQEYQMILDIGPQTAADLAERIRAAGTILWNGPVGVFEIDQFSAGTRVIAEAIAASDGYSLAGGGDTLAALDRFEVREHMSYVSTGGGAFIEFVEGKRLPAVAALEERGIA